MCLWALGLNVQATRILQRRCVVFIAQSVKQHVKICRAVVPTRPTCHIPIIYEYNNSTQMLNAHIVNNILNNLIMISIKAM